MNKNQTKNEDRENNGNQFYQRELRKSIRIRLRGFIEVVCNNRKIIFQEKKANINNNKNIKRMR